MAAYYNRHLYTFTYQLTQPNLQLAISEWCRKWHSVLAARSRCTLCPPLVWFESVVLSTPPGHVCTAPLLPPPLEKPFSTVERLPQLPARALYSEQTWQHQWVNGSWVGIHRHRLGTAQSTTISFVHSWMPDTLHTLCVHTHVHPSHTRIHICTCTHTLFEFEQHAFSQFSHRLTRPLGCLDHLT